MQIETVFPYNVVETDGTISFKHGAYQPEEPRSREVKSNLPHSPTLICRSASSASTGLFLLLLLSPECQLFPFT